MNNAQDNQERSKPHRLVLLIAVGTIILTIVNYLCTTLFFRFFGQSTGSLVQSLLNYSFWMPCVVWLSARRSSTSWSTWIVPLLLLSLVAAGPVLISIWQMLVFGYYGLDIFMWVSWENSIKTSILLFVLLSFFFRASTLHLRPVESRPSLHRLRVANIMLLTAIVAVCMSIDTLVQQTIGKAFAPSFFAGRSVYFLMGIFSSAAIAALWFSIAWLFVPGNPKRWIGVLGIALFVVGTGILHLVSYAMYANQTSSAIGGGINLFGSGYFLGMFVISILHAGVNFLCVGAMHWAGYRWDIYRQSPASESVIQEQVDEEPKRIVVSRIEI